MRRFLFAVMRRFLFAVMCVFGLTFLVPMQVFAIAPDQGSSLIVRTGSPNAFVKIYDVGVFDSSSNQYSMDPAFASYNTDLNQAISDPQAARDLFQKFQADTMACLRCNYADEHGEIRFYDLTPGVYLIGNVGLNTAKLTYVDGTGEFNIISMLPVAESDSVENFDSNQNAKPGVLISENITPGLGAAMPDFDLFPNLTGVSAISVQYAMLSGVSFSFLTLLTLLVLRRVL